MYLIILECVTTLRYFGKLEDYTVKVTTINVAITLFPKRLIFSYLVGRNICRARDRFGMPVQLGTLIDQYVRKVEKVL
ncbi:MAG: hypothetical protein DHS20C12_02590 [Pseudohongiella sp.]|nr:MAG: hypothetical protein DHS20C12_02590 [Pseudohongiella sp.]